MVGSATLLILGIAPARGDYSHRETQTPSINPVVEAVGDAVAIGDVHGCLRCLQRVLATNRITDPRSGVWIAGNRTVVQMGDLIDRGPDDKSVIDYVRQLAAQADAAGGQWVQLLGNHELMNLEGRFDYAVDRPGDERTPQQGFGSLSARILSMDPTADIGRWLRSLPIIHRWEHTIFVHAGISEPRIARLGIDKLNRAWQHSPQITDHVLWDRTLALAPEPEVCHVLSAVVEAFGGEVEQIVVGHTITSHAGIAAGAIGTRCAGKLLLVDVGMSHAWLHGGLQFDRAAHFFSSRNA